MLQIKRGRWSSDPLKFEELLGTIILKIEGAERGNGEITFRLLDGRIFQLYHDQDCCESVSIEDIAGDITDLLDSPILVAEESVGERPADVPVPDWEDSETWTFYRIGTIKGTVVIRWLGSSNGYYSESVDFAEMEEEE